MSKTLQVYKRLLGFAKPYSLRLAAGILCGVLAGGSLFGALQFAPAILSPFEAGPAPAAGSPSATVATTAPDPAVTAGAAGDILRSRELTTARKWADRLGVQTTRADGSMTWQFMFLSIIGLPFFVGLKSLATFLNHYFMRWVGSRAVVDLRDQLFDRLIGQSLKYFGKVDIGSLVSRCTYDATIIENTIATSIADLTQAPVEIAAAAGFIVYFALHHDLLGTVVVVFIAFPVCVLPIIILGRAVKRHTRRSLERISDLVSRMQEVFTGIRVVKAFHTETTESTRFHSTSVGYFRAVIRALRAELLMTPMMECVGVILACAFLVYCYALGIQLSQIVPVGAAAMLIYRPVKQLAKANANIQRSMAAADRLFAILDTDTALREKPDALPLREFRDRIVFEGVDYTYDIDGLPVLRDISFSLTRGTAIAFVGETGSGKTTVAGLLARFYDPVKGRVALDGHDLRDVQIASLRRLVGMVTQETILFNDTVAFNIAYGTPGATREDIVAAARKANAHEFIISEPEGYDRVVGEKGFRLSGGQRQRIAIARAILKNPPILILDEATNALDSVTEQQVQEALYRLMQDRTVFVIAHRLSTIKNCHQIYVLDKGRIVEHGTHAELHAAGGLYRRLCESQFAAES